MADIATKAEKYDKLMAGLRNIVTCPVCMSIPEKGPIASCPNGHLVCPPCQQEIMKVKGKLLYCPTCRGTMGKNLNLTAKMLIESMEHVCTNEGCNEILSHQELAKHKQELCKFREIPSNAFKGHSTRAEDIENESASSSNVWPDNPLSYDSVIGEVEQAMEIVQSNPTSSEQSEVDGLLTEIDNLIALAISGGFF